MGEHICTKVFDQWNIIRVQPFYVHLSFLVDEQKRRIHIQKYGHPNVGQPLKCVEQCSPVKCRDWSSQRERKDHRCPKEESRVGLQSINTDEENPRQASRAEVGLSDPGEAFAELTHLCKSGRKPPAILAIYPKLVLRIRIHRIHMFLGLLDPDPLVRDMDPDLALVPDPSIILSRNSKKNLDFYCFVISF
jgi:hypothetical protein